MSTNKSKMGSGFGSENEITEPPGEEASKREAKARFTEEGFERVRRRVEAGEAVTCAVKAEGMGISWFYERVGEKPEWVAALQKARQEKMVEALEDEVCRLVFDGEPSRFTGRGILWGRSGCSRTGC
jgi:hypothetical protein